jgi:hypothetical protein
VRYFATAVIAAILLSIGVSAQWAVAYATARGGVPGQSVPAILLGWIVLAFGLAVPVLLGWLRTRKGAPSGNAVAAAGLFGALAAFAAGPVPAALLSALSPDSIVSSGMSAGFALTFAPLTAGFCATAAWITETFFTRLAAPARR